jgi:two-component system, NarL family, nitrate/nitrite response regulator NarL
MSVEPMGRSAPAPRGEFAGPPSKVLVLGEDLLVAEAIVFALVRQGFLAREIVPASIDDVRRALVWSPDLALVDVDLVATDPVECVRMLVALGVTVAVTGRSSQRGSLDLCVEAGAGAVIEASVALSGLLLTLDRLSSEGKSLPRPRPTSEQPALAPRRDLLALFAILTPREQFVLAELMEGRTADTIARSAFVAVSTVRSQIKAILQKLGVNSQLAAVALARRAGWVHACDGGALPPVDRSVGRSPGGRR